MKDRDIYDLIRQRAKSNSTLNESEKIALAEIQSFLTTTKSNIQAVHSEAVSQRNEFERHATGFVGLAISFIVAGMLANAPETTETTLTKTVFLLAVAFALVSAGLLFFEYAHVTKLFDQRIKDTDKLNEYIDSKQWNSLEEINEYIQQSEAGAAHRSSNLFQLMERVTIIAAFALMLAWLALDLFTQGSAYLATIS